MADDAGSANQNQSGTNNHNQNNGDLDKVESELPGSTMQPLKTGIPRLKLVVVGDGACGKTSLLTVFASGQFPVDHVPTIFETTVHTSEVDGKEVEFALWDTAGQEDFDRLRPMSYSKTDVVLICYSIDRPDSLANVETQWAKEIKHFCKGVPIILVGNKTDLRDDAEIKQNLEMLHQTPITVEQARSSASKIHAHAWVECSSKLNDNVAKVFEIAGRAAILKKKRTLPSRIRCEIL